LMGSRHSDPRIPEILSRSSARRKASSRLKTAGCALPSVPPPSGSGGASCTQTRTRSTVVTALPGSCCGRPASASRGCSSRPWEASLRRRPHESASLGHSLLQAEGSRQPCRDVPDLTAQLVRHYHSP
jgi:hypothetical protein